MPLECQECASQDAIFDEQLEKDFRILVCDKCKSKNQNDRYKLITKSEAKSTYLLTDQELNSIPHILKPNPKRPNWAKMHLYLICQVESTAIAKWKSLEALLQEHEKREQAQEIRKKKKFDCELKALRKKLQKPKQPKSAQSHCVNHEFTYEKVESSLGDKSIAKCKICSFSTIFEEI